MGIRLRLISAALFILSVSTWPCFCRNSTLYCREEERDALLEFKQSIQLDPPNLLQSWEGHDCCKWNGVGCNPKSGHVIKLELSGTYLSGSDPYLHLGNLTSLEVLDLQLAGSTVNDVRWISQLTSLKYLDMRGISTQARDMMQELSMLPSLSYLSLASCGLTNLHLPRVGVFNTNFFPSLSHLNLSGNSFQGTLPNMFQNMSSLSYLDLAFNQFNTFDSPFWLISSLRYLDISGNEFQGQLPGSFQNMASLTFLNLAGNSFSLVPSWFINLKSLVHLDLSGNSFENSEGGFLLLVREKCDLRFLNLDFSRFKGEMTTGNSTWFCATNLESFSASYSRFQGKLPDWLGDLKMLKYLRLDNNLFSGAIPHSWGTLSSLTNLDISFNQLHGAIPEGLGQLRSLQTLQLQHNLLNGMIPKSIGQLQDLQLLDFSDNSLEGSISEAHFSNLSKLKYLHLSNNHLVIEVDSNWKPPFQLSAIRMGSCKFGTQLPQWLGTQGSASIWNLSNANIVGELPEWFGDLGLNSVDLDFSHNQIIGPIPNFSISSGYLDLSHNNFSGPIPDFIALKGSLVLSYNQISGSIPNFSFTGYLDLSHNQISGSIPNFFALKGSLDLSFNQISGPVSNLTAFDGSLYLSQNQISGPIPTTLEVTGVLDLSHNKISGPVPTFSVFGSSLDLSFNQISRPIPSNIGESCPELLYLNDNLITGPIPTSLCDAKNLLQLDLSRNKLSESIPDCWGNGGSPFLYFIDLSSNNLSGEIPRSFGNISYLTSLHLNNNSLHGDLPTSLQYLGSLKVLDVGENNIGGDIPAWIGKELQSLRILRLRDNQFNGRIPSELCLIPELHVLDLAGNKLQGMIPGCFSNITGMIEVASPDQVFTKVPNTWDHEQMVEVIQGRDLEYTTNLQFVVSLDLSSNNLVGLIPWNLTRLKGLLALNLSHNSFSGEIPKNIGDMKFLVSLDLSNNQLSGAIPPSIADLTMLSHLNLSNNNLSGRIPEGNQLDTLYQSGKSIYGGNPLLCGDPLPEKCPGEKVPGNPNYSRERAGKGSDSFEKLIFYGVTSVGFFTGFWGVIGVLVFNKKWRAAYFNFAEEIANRVYVAVAMKMIKLKRIMRST